MSSSDTDDDNHCKFLEAVDTNFINDGMFQSAAANVKVEDVIKGDPKVITKSNRFLGEGENVFQSDINVTESMKKYIGKKLSTLIEQQFEFVEANDNENIQCHSSSEHGGIRLFKDCNEFLKITVEDTDELNVKKKQRKISKRLTENDEFDERMKLKLAAVEPSYIHASTKCWSNRPKSELYEYSNKGNCFVQKTPSNEFSERRVENNWNEAMIVNFRKTMTRKRKTKCSLLD
ncbi:uncharacterized protein LOC129775583 [Toxorhynchites rutilus septentrionalis]|uniref:uncharacterized protein LOC129775583 n=1 Tax=Toxorhynchites rutilus septentrionalis TaxID=329112 RepID=UPI00247A37C0|nr:uncharacterized protein LOC129775583 [Toxorhynchites rutilus septentrionalis]